MSIETINKSSFNWTCDVNLNINPGTIKMFSPSFVHPSNGDEWQLSLQLTVSKPVSTINDQINHEIEMKTRITAIKLSIPISVLYDIETNVPITGFVNPDAANDPDDQYNARVFSNIGSGDFTTGYWHQFSDTFRVTSEALNGNVSIKTTLIMKYIENLII